MTKDEFYFWTTVATITISICALSLAIWNGYLTRTHNKLCVKPFITSFLQESSTNLTFTITNCGLGPAEIEEFTIFANGKKINNHEEFNVDLESLLATLTLQKLYTEYNKLGHIIDIKGSSTILEIKADSLAPEEIKTILNRYRLVVKYKSLYGQRFEFDSIKFL
jgi:hypothetical protein